MNPSHINHLQININPENIRFYKDLLTSLGWAVIYEDSGMLGIGNELMESLWFSKPIKPLDNDYDGTGMNHLGISAPSIADVDRVVSWLNQRRVPPLFDTPRHRPDFSPNPERTYYQVMFESPDRILIEVVYTGPIAG